MEQKGPPWRQCWANTARLISVEDGQLAKCSDLTKWVDLSHAAFHGGPVWQVQ